MLDQKPTTEAEPDSLQQRLQSLPLFARELIAGGLAGGLGKTSVAPLERTKILFQTGRLQSKSVWDTLVWLYTNEGVAGLYRGNGASVLRIVPYAAIHFSSYEYYRRWIVEGVAAQWVGSTGRVHPVLDLLAGSTAGATAVAATYPLDLVRTRLAWATESALVRTGATKHHIWSVLSDTFRHEGPRGLYHGVAPTMLGILPYAGLKFYVYQSLKVYYRTLGTLAPIVGQAAAGPSSSHSTSAPGGSGGSSGGGSGPGSSRPAAGAQGQVGASGEGGVKEGAAARVVVEKGAERLPVPVMLVFGGLAGLAAQTATYPLDVIRRRMQVEGLQEAKASRGLTQGDVPHTPRSGIWQTTRLLVRENGVRGLFRGLSINYMKVVPSTAIGFTAYDALKSYLGVVNNI